jgi:hypothetical protein
MWTLIFGHHDDRTPTHGYEPTREAAMAAFAKNWAEGIRPCASLTRRLQRRFFLGQLRRFVQKSRPRAS